VCPIYCDRLCCRHNSNKMCHVEEAYILDGRCAMYKIRLPEKPPVTQELMAPPFYSGCKREKGKYKSVRVKVFK